MSSAPPTIGHYRILDKLGAGGMGEVYRARDSKLNRDVAIKVLPEAFANDADRLARFTREAQTLAALNHPNIGAIYGIEESPSTGSGQGGTRALVMELVEGEDLSVRLARGPIPIDEAVPIARQIAEAVEAAHEQGVVHRDLKPANVKVRQDGTVKVLDFGLAKAAEQASGAGLQASGPTLATSPTFTSPAQTRMGMIIGTAAYMAPEQARGRSVDKRADIWAFGVVLYEMLTGRRAFQGEDVSDVLASVLRQDIDWSALPADTPPPVRRLLERCLDRDVKQRLRDIGEARVALASPNAVEPPTPATPAPAVSSSAPPPLWRRLAPVAAVGLIASAATGAVLWRQPPQVTPPVTRFAITLPSHQVALRVARNIVAVSPDGTQIAYVVDRQLYLKRLADVEGRPINGSEDRQSIMGPVFSPDGASIAYYSWGEQAIRRIPAAGGTAVTVCVTEGPSGLSWDGDDVLFGLPGGVMRVSANGGTPELVVPARASEGERVFGPQMLPGGKAVLFTSTNAEPWNVAGKIVAVSLPSGARTIVVDGGAADARYLPSGHILFVRGGVVHAVAFDATTLQARGTPVRLIEGVRRSEDSSGMDLSVSSTGMLAYVPGAVSGEDLKLAFFGRDGGPQPLAVPAGNYAQPRLSPDGRRIAMGTVDAADTAIWIADTTGTAAPRRLTFDGATRFPAWSHDGERVTFQSQHGEDKSLFWQRADGSGAAERLTQAPAGASHAPQAWSPDGNWLLYDETKEGLVAIWLYSRQNQTSRVLVSENSRVPSDATFSPDGRWIAYTTEENSLAMARVFVQPFPPTGAKYLISGPEEDAHHPSWSRDGRELFYTPGPGSRIQRVAVTTTPAFQFRPAVTLPRRFTNAPPTHPRTYDVAADGRFLGLIEAEALKESGTPLSQIYVVLNWFEELKTKVPSR